VNARGDDERKALRRALSERYTRERGHLLPALHHVQHEFGYLPDWAMETVSRHLRVPKSEVYGAATSYSELTLDRPGRHTLRVCTGLGCSLRGAGELLESVNEALDATPIAGDTTVAEIACGFLCGVAPAVQWDGRWIGRATAESVRRLIAATESE
jgi:NADH:ubiquinone oxidoreductase subunit E